MQLFLKVSSLSEFAVLGLAGQIWPGRLSLQFFLEVSSLSLQFLALLARSSQIWLDLAWKAEFAVLP